MSFAEELRFIQLLQPQVVAQVHDYLYFHCDVSYDSVLDVAFLWKHNGQLVVETEQIVCIFRFKRKLIQFSMLNSSTPFVVSFLFRLSNKTRCKYSICHCWMPVNTNAL